MEDASSLVQIVTDNDITDALWSIGEETSPDPDGYNSKFFKEAWGTVSPYFMRVVHGFFQKGKLLKCSNHASIALVLKGPHISSVTDVRRRSCGNTTYKVISKIIANRLITVLYSIIDPSQTAFIKGRKISENIHLAQALLRQYDDLLLLSRRDTKSVSTLRDTMGDFKTHSGLITTILSEYCVRVL